MIKRNLLKILEDWAQNENHKPLVIRGARQVGKTTLVRKFGESFDEFISLNLEKEEDKNLFENTPSLDKIIEILQLTRMKNYNSIQRKRILIFIDEIQNSPRAIGFLRYFYEDFPEFYVITAGSRLQELFKTGVSFPVGRVEYLTMRPCFFNEFLEGFGKEEISERIENIDIPDYIHSVVMDLFQTYTVIGGMPEALTRYYHTANIHSLSPIYSSLINGYNEDVEKYSSSASQTSTLRHILRNGWNYAGQTISFAGFAGSSFSSSMVHGAFELLEKAFLVNLDYPVTSVKLPAEQNLRRYPKLIWLDSGLVNFSAGIQAEFLQNQNLNDVWRGHAAEQIVAQELWKPLDLIYNPQQSYWMRDKKGSTAEVDFIFPYKGKIIPIEVKSGHNSHLRSLHSFMSQDGAVKFGIRIWSGPFCIDDIYLKGAEVTARLVNVPFYYTGIIDKIIDKYY